MMRRLIIYTVFRVLPVVILFSTGASALNAADARGYDWFWFLYEQDRISCFPSKTVTPFYHTVKLDDNEDYTASLPPLLFWKYTNDHSISRNWLLGLAGDVDYTHANGTEDYDMGLMPFILYGNSPDKKDRYFFLWPIGGTFKGKLVMDYVSPWVFPGVALFFLYPPQSLLYLPLYIIASVIPAYVSYGRGDYSAHGIFWPLIQWGSSPDRSDFRVLPFYSHNTKKDYYDNRSWFLLFNYDRTFMPGNREIDTFMVTPFFARRWDNQHIAGASTLFWPFFSWGYNKKLGDFEINFPWPFIVYQRSEKPFVRKKIFFPFYGHIVHERDETEFITPLYFRMKRDNDSFSSDYTITALIIWNFYREYKNEPSEYYGNKWHFFKIWPLFRYESNDKGDVHFNLLSILPLRDPAGYEKIYDPLFSLIEYHREKDVRRFGLLLRTYYQCWDDRTFQSRVPLLFRYASFDGKITEFTILCSMFGYEKNGEGSYFRCFWIPIRIGEGTGESISEIGDEALPTESIPQYMAKSSSGDFVIGRVSF